MYVPEYKEAFLMVDKTDTGFIPKSELGKCVRTLGLNPRESELNNVQSVADAEGNNNCTCGKETSP